MLRTQTDIEKVNGLLRRAESNLSSVTQSMGDRTTPPTGSAGKLLARRLEQVIGDLTPAKELLDTIPAGTEGRDEAATRYSTAATEYNRLITIMNGGAAPPPASDGTETVKLNYQQEDLLGNARFHTREVRGNATHLTTKTEALKVVPDQLTINYREVEALRGVVQNARTKTGYARDALNKLPENGAGVAAVKQELVNADAEVSIAHEYLEPLHVKLQDLINPANYPEFNADRDRLRELSRMFSSPEILQTERQLAIETFNQVTPSKEECIRVAQRYQRLMQQQTEQGKQIEGIGNGFLANHAEFLSAVEAQRASLPAEIRKHMDQARTYAAEAVAAQKPLWFTGGIPQSMAFAEDGMKLLVAIAPAAGAELQKEFTQTQADLKKQAEALRELIIRENRMPSDNYKGEDREKAIAVALSGWKVQQAEFKLLKVRIPAEAWARETKWTYSNGTWYFSDRSRLQLRLLVADHENKELAIDRAINVWMDHQAGDSMIGVPLRGFDDELQPSDYMLRANVK